MKKNLQVKIHGFKLNRKLQKLETQNQTEWILL